MIRSIGLRAGMFGLLVSSLAAASVTAAPFATSPAPATGAAPAAATAISGSSSATAATMVAALTTATCTAGTSTCPIPITFAPGALSGQRSAWMSGIRSVRWFSIRARARQTMVVVVKGAGPTRGTVYFPNGLREGQPGGRVFDGQLPVSGTYRIRVTESPMGSAWAGRVTVVVLAY